MRYRSARKYPITQMKKEQLQNSGQDRIMDLSVGAAVGLLAFAFAEGLIWGYVCCRGFHRYR